MDYEKGDMWLSHEDPRTQKDYYFNGKSDRPMILLRVANTSWEIDGNGCLCFSTMLSWVPKIFSTPVLNIMYYILIVEKTQEN